MAKRKELSVVKISKEEMEFLLAESENEDCKDTSTLEIKEVELQDE